MTRKEFLLASAAAASSAWAVPRTHMGIATTCYLTAWRPKDTYEFLEHCQALGAGGIQASLASTDPAYVKKLRARAEQGGMYLEFMIGLPKEDTSAFEATVKAAKGWRKNNFTFLSNVFPNRSGNCMSLWGGLQPAADFNRPLCFGFITGQAD